MTWEEIIAMYDDGELSKGDALTHLTDVAVANGIARTLREMPVFWRKELELWIFNLYDNDVDADDYFYIGRDQPDPAEERRKIELLRTWITGRKVSDGQP